MKLGRKCFNQHKQGRYPDHTYSPEAFAYALHQHEFSSDEEMQIQFDHEESVLEFIQEYKGGTNWPDYILQNILK